MAWRIDIFWKMLVSLLVVNHEKLWEEFLFIVYPDTF
jgi:hypothetical protein